MGSDVTLVFFAQSASTVILTEVIGVVGFLGLIALLVAAGVASERVKKRGLELLHEQRMKAMELGVTIAEDRPRPPPSGRVPAMMIGFGVPTVLFTVALAYSLSIREENWSGFSKTHMAWTASGAVSLAAVICGTILAFRRPAASPRERSEPTSVARVSRPVKDGAIDPDAIDVAGRRG
jgi:hypothetical protein